MTVSSQTSNETFFGNGVTTVWDLPFRFFDNSDIQASIVNPSTGTSTPLVLGTDYSLTGAGQPEQFGTAPGKITTFTPVAAGLQLYVERVMLLEQLTDIINQGQFFPEIHEDVFDRLTMLIQQMTAGINRALKMPPGLPYYDALSHQIKNILDPTDAQDAATMSWAVNYIAQIIQTGQGPFNNAANVVYIYPDNTPHVVQDLSNPVGSSGIGHGVGTLKSFADNQVPTVFEFDTENRLGTGDIAYDTATIQAAINGTSGALSLGEFGSTFTVSRLTGRSNLDLQGRATLDYSTNAAYAMNVADPLFKFPGTAGPARALTGNVAPGSKVIPVDTTGIVAGDIIEIGTPGYAGDFIDTSTAVSNAETRKVARIISASQLELADPIVDEIGYSTANLGQVRLLSTVKNVTLREGVTIKGKGRPASGAGDIGVVFFYGENVKVHSKFLGVDSSAVRFESCYGAEAAWCRVKHDPQGANTTVNYGIVPSSSSSWVKIHDCFFENMRHAVVTSHLSAALGLGIIGVVRELDIHNNYIVNTWHAGIATHNDADRVRIFDNMLVGCFQGINPRERNIEITRNNFHRCNQGIVATSHPRNLLIADNTFEDTVGSAILGTWDGARDCSDLTIRGNKATRMGGGIAITLPAPIVAHVRIVIEDFIATTITGAGGSQAVIRINGASFTGGVIAFNKINGATGAAGVAISDGANDLPIFSNVVRNVSGNPFSTAGTLVNVWGKGNYYSGSWSGSSGLANSATVLTDNTIY